jgi:hypothetical protein
MTLSLPIVNLQTGAEFGDMTQILRNLGSCPPPLEFGAICEFSSRGNKAKSFHAAGHGVYKVEIKVINMEVFGCLYIE